MTNSFFSPPPQMAPGTKARATDINAISQAINSAFDRLPGESALKGGFVNYAPNLGTTDNAYVVLMDPKITAIGYVDGLEVKLLPTRANTGACTLNVNGLGNIPIKRSDGSDPQASDLPANAVIPLTYQAGANVFRLPSVVSSQVIQAIGSGASAQASASAAAASAASAQSYLQQVTSFLTGAASTVISFFQAGTGAVLRTVRDKLRESVSMQDFGAVGDGVTDDTAAVLAAITYASTSGKRLNLNGATYLVTANIPSLHDVKYAGPGYIKRGTDMFAPVPGASDTNTLYISPTGLSTNDGLTAAMPMSDVRVFAVLPNYGPILEGQWNIRLAAGTYAGGNTMTGLRSRNYLAFYGPDVGGHPNVPTAIVDGTSSAADHGWYFQTNMTLKVQDIKFQNWTTKAYSHGITVLEASKLYTVNVHTQNCSYGGVDVEDRSQLILSGGVHNNAMYGIRATYHCTVSIGYNGATAGRPQITGTTAGGSGILLSDYSQGHIDYTDLYGCGGSGGAVGLVNMSRVDLNYCVFGAGTPNYYNVSCSIGSTYIDNVSNTFNAATIKSIVLLGFSLDWSNNGNVFYDQATGRIRIGSSTSYAAPAGRLHVKDGDASPSYASSTVVAIESTTSPYLSFGSPGTTEAGMLWSKPSVTTQAKFFYNFTDDTFRMLVAAGSTVFKWGATFFVPPTDNATTNGSASFRWSVIYAGTGTINTSDEREKQQIESINPAAIRAIRRVNLVQFKFNDAVEAKGNGARWHFGVIAQQVKAAFEAEGLDAFDYGVLCYDEWTDEFEPVFGERVVHADDGTEMIQQYDTGEKRLVKAAGNRYGVRYDELLVLRLAAIEAGGGA
jgi:hypothetical protein